MNISFNNIIRTFRNFHMRMPAVAWLQRPALRGLKKVNQKPIQHPTGKATIVTLRWQGELKCAKFNIKTKGNLLFSHYNPDPWVAWEPSDILICLRSILDPAQAGSFGDPESLKYWSIASGGSCKWRQEKKPLQNTQIRQSRMEAFNKTINLDSQLMSQWPMLKWKCQSFLAVKERETGGSATAV